MQSLATKYRPKEFSEICSQSTVIKILEKQIETKNINHAMIFCGASGCGKTTAARIFANKLNEGLGEPVEFDAASHSSVDDIRESILPLASKRPIDCNYRIIIVDECQSIGNGSANASNKGWQALLKAIEEPPEFTVFIFCTTDPQKIPATILNRCQRFNFHRIDPATINNRLRYICEQEHFTNYNETCDYISRICNGEMRKGISYLEKCAAYSTDLSISNCNKVLDTYSYDVYFELVNNIIDGKDSEVLKIIDTIYSEGNDLKLFVNQFLSFILDLTKYSIFRDIRMTGVPASELQKLDNACNFDGATKYYNYYIDKLLELKNMLKDDTDAKSTVEIMMLRITRLG